MENLIRPTKKKRIKNGIRIRSTCGWYEHREKSSKFFPNLEKSRAVQNQIRKILIGNIEANNQKDINNKLYSYYKNLFNERQHLPEHDINNFLNAVSKFYTILHSFGKE